MDVHRFDKEWFIQVLMGFVPFILYRVILWLIIGGLLLVLHHNIPMIWN
jgi:hypothetical protein